MNPKVIPLILSMLAGGKAEAQQIQSKEAFVETGSFRHHPAIRMELVAMEPDVVDPVAASFGADGSMYVVEMRDYPYGEGPTGSPGGTIRKLLLDGEGRLRSSHLFATGLSFPTSIACYREGILVAAKDLVYLADTDGDHLADVRQVVLTGFNQKVTDSNFNGLRWGIDNRLHGVNGGNDGHIHEPGKPERGVSLNGADFTWDPWNQRTARSYHTGGGFGLVFDDYGRSFTTHNINHMLQRILPVEAMERFRGFPALHATVNISNHGAMARIYTISKAETRVNHPEQAGFFSSSGGMGILPETFRHGDLAGDLLVCDVVGNLVHRDVLHGHGPTFEARRAPEEKTREFIASRDNAFRPVGLEPGPDGCLYLMDMQRSVIEHPDYIPSQIKGRYDIRGGQDRGRIYRIRPTGTEAIQTRDLASMSSTSLIPLLGEPNRWSRITAQRLLLERQDIGKRSKWKGARDSSNPLLRMHSLWVMHGLNLLQPGDILRTLEDTHPGLRSQAMRLLWDHPEWWNQLWTKIQALAWDNDPIVRFETALMLGNHPHPDNHLALMHIMRLDKARVWSRRAVLTSLRTSPSLFLAGWWRHIHTGISTPHAIMQTTARHNMLGLKEIAYLAGARLDSVSCIDLKKILELNERESATIDPEAFRAILAGIKRGAERVSLGSYERTLLKPVLESIARHKSLPLRKEVWALSQTLGFKTLPGFEVTLKEALIRAVDNKEDLSERVVAIELAGLGSFAQSGKTLIGLLKGLEPMKIQESALKQMASYSSLDIAHGIIERWREIGPGLRPMAIELLLRRKDFHLPLIQAIENGDVKLGELNLDLEQRRLLRRYGRGDVKQRAAALFGDEEYSNRKDLLDDWLQNMPSQGRGQHGAVIFKEQCAPCHRSGDMGMAVGPDLTDMSHRSVEDLAFNILDPNMAINPSYVAYEAETEDGELLTGIVTAQTPESISLLLPQGINRELPRDQLVTFRSGGLSLMPEGFEERLTPQQLRDLISFLQEKP
jgi:putative membrane-bound dehydrogenase-like protein